jgi:hypothetical protein
VLCSGVGQEHSSPSTMPGSSVRPLTPPKADPFQTLPVTYRAEDTSQVMSFVESWRKLTSWNLIKGNEEI